MSVDVSKINPGDQVLLQAEALDRPDGFATVRVKGCLHAISVLPTAIASHTPRRVCAGDRVILKAWAGAPRCSSAGSIIAVHGDNAWVKWPSLSGPCTERVDKLARADD